MFGYRAHDWGSEPVWEELPEPSPGPDEVLVAVEACGVGLTVVNNLEGNLADRRATLPRVPGHELVGRVVEVGPGSDEQLLGHRVTAYFYLNCGRCSECVAGREQRCTSLGGFVGVHRDGGYAPLTALPLRNAIQIPEGIDPVTATVIPDAVATPLHVAARAGITADDLVVVIGAAGGVGAHMIQVARLTGAEVVGLDLGEAKLELIGELGADPVSSASFTDLSVRIKGRSPSVVVDLVGREESLAWGRRALGPGGRQVVLTTFPEQAFPLSPAQMVFGELEMIGSRYATKAQVARAAELVGSGAVRPVIGRVVAPRQALDLHGELLRHTLLGRGAIDWQA